MAKNQSPLESWEQAQVIRWKRANQIKYPALQLMHASMNGIRVGQGTKKKMKEQGLAKGFPDLMLDVARRGYHGLRIELKRVSGGAVSRDQKRIIGMLIDENYYAVVCKGHKEAIDCVKWYLGI